MGFLSLFFDKPQRILLDDTGDTGGVGALEIDATLSAAYTMQSKVTKLPVEDGSVVTDHIIKENRKFNIDGIITGNPIAIGVFSSTFLSNLYSLERVKTGYEILRGLWETKALFTIITKLDKFYPVAITSLSIIQDQETGKSLRFSASVEEVVIVKTQNVFLKKEKELAEVDPESQGAVSTVNKGNQATKSATSSAVEKNQSWAKQIF